LINSFIHSLIEADSEMTVEAPWRQ
jgi:hypothetical protein